MAEVATDDLSTNASRHDQAQARTGDFPWLPRWLAPWVFFVCSVRLLVIGATMALLTRTPV